jgi:hypothetical protein
MFQTVEVGMCFRVHGSTWCLKSAGAGMPGGTSSSYYMNVSSSSYDMYVSSSS